MIITDILTNTRKFETKIQRLAAESEFLKQTSQGEQATQAFDMLLEMLQREQSANPDYPSDQSKMAEQLAESLFWAVQSVLRPDNKSDRELLLAHDPDLKFVLAYLTLQPVAENNACLSLQLYPRAAVLLKQHPTDPGRITMRASFDYEDGGIQTVLDLVKLEIDRRTGATHKIVGKNRLAENDHDREAINMTLQNLQTAFDRRLEQLKIGQIPDDLFELTPADVHADKVAFRQLSLREGGANASTEEATA